MSVVRRSGAGAWYAVGTGRALPDLAQNRRPERGDTGHDGTYEDPWVKEDQRVLRRGPSVRGVSGGVSTPSPIPERTGVVTRRRTTEGVQTDTSSGAVRGTFTTSPSRPRPSVSRSVAASSSKTRPFEGPEGSRPDNGDHPLYSPGVTAV